MHSGAVIDAFEVRVAGVLPRVAEHDRRDTLIELERFDDAHGSDRLASFIWERLESGADGEVVNQLFEATGELGLNVLEHAGSPAGGFVAAQRYRTRAVARGFRRCRWRPRARRRHVDPDRCRLEDDHPEARDNDRRVSPARNDCRCSVALSARQVT
jgi:hypothetical protein